MTFFTCILVSRIESAGYIDVAVSIRVEDIGCDVFDYIDLMMRIVLNWTSSMSCR